VHPDLRAEFVKAIICASLGAGIVADYFRALASALQERGHEVTLVTWHAPGAATFGPPGVRLVRFPSARPTRLRDAVFLARLVRGMEANCIIANFGAVNVATVVGWLLSVPVRIGWHRTLRGQVLADHWEPTWLHRFQVLRKRWVYAMCTHVVGNSKASVEELRSFWRIPDRKIQMFWNTMPDPGEMLPAKARQEGSIVCAGRLDPSKGQEVLLRALPLVRKVHETAHVVFLGDGPEHERLVKLTDELGIARAVEFRGFVSHHEVVTCMAHASVVAVPSYDEAFGNTNMEALSVGTPVVASRVGGIPEVIRHGQDGLLYSAGDPSQMAECLNTLLGDHGLREGMGRSARQRFHEMFETTAVLNARVQWFEHLERH